MAELPMGTSARASDPAGIPAQQNVVTSAASGWDVDAAVLLVEDDSGDALLVEELLADSELNSSLTWCKSLAEAQRFLRSCHTPVCVLLDLHLPDVQGLDAVRQLVDSAPDAAIVVTTGLAEAETGLSAVAHGAQDYLVKGRIDPEALGRAVRYALQRKQAERSASAMRTSQLIAKENARLERALLPIPLLLDDSFAVAARYEAGRAHGLLSGDFYDVVQTPDGAVHAVIGDVSGHGAAEAALGVCLRVAWRTAVLTGVTQLEKISLLEQILVAERSDAHVFATVTALVFPPGRDRVRIVRAGHPGLLLRRGTDITWVEPDAGMALGLLPGAGRWTVTELDLLPGNECVLFTDGLFEGRTGPHSRLGEEGLLAMARRHGALAPRAFVDALVAETTEKASPYGGLADDVAVLHLGWRADS